jgi:hypothetical protein
MPFSSSGLSSDNLPRKAAGLAACIEHAPADGRETSTRGAQEDVPEADDGSPDIHVDLESVVVD